MLNREIILSGSAFPRRGASDRQQILECFMDMNTENTGGAWDRVKNNIWPIYFTSSSETPVQTMFKTSPIQFAHNCTSDEWVQGRWLPFSVLNWVGQRNCLYHVTGWHSKGEDHKGKDDFKQKQHTKTPCTDVVGLVGIVAFLTKVVLWCDR